VSVLSWRFNLPDGSGLIRYEFRQELPDDFKIDIITGAGDECTQAHFHKGLAGIRKNIRQLLLLKEPKRSILVIFLLPEHKILRLRIKQGRSGVDQVLLYLYMVKIIFPE